jgi:hypothetical protein
MECEYCASAGQQPGLCDRCGDRGLHRTISPPVTTWKPSRNRKPKYTRIEYAPSAEGTGFGASPVPEIEWAAALTSPLGAAAGLAIAWGPGRMEVMFGRPDMSSYPRVLLMETMFGGGG